MAKKTTEKGTEKAQAMKTSDLEALAGRLDAMSKEAADLGEEMAAKAITKAAKSCRWFDKQRATRIKRVGGLVEKMKAQGLTAEQIIARLTSGKA